MKKLTKATNDSTKMLRYYTFQSSISTRIGHYIMLGQNETALRLLQESEGTLKIPDELDEDDDEDSENERPRQAPRWQEEDENIDDDEPSSEERPKKKSKIIVNDHEVEDHESVEKRIV
jgi:hypothetical protein